MTADETAPTLAAVIRPVEMVLAPVDPDDPNDDGIIRAMPQAKVLNPGGGTP